MTENFTKLIVDTKHQIQKLREHQAEWYFKAYV